jgi:diadenylate cyclase
LASFGTGRRFFGFLKGTSDYLDINEIVESYQALAHKKIGALMVLERTQGLANYISTGSRIDANIHSDLIYSIFQTHSPLHDGAVIVSKDKMAAAGCFLPLSRNTSVDRSLGTRHRAALGISEDTDAIALTVSEETGRINIAVGGRFYHCAHAHELRQYLKHLFLGEKLDTKLSPIVAGEELT